MSVTKIGEAAGGWGVEGGKLGPLAVKNMH